MIEGASLACPVEEDMINEATGTRLLHALPAFCLLACLACGTI